MMKSGKNDIFNWLRLARTEGIGPVTFFGLITKYGNAKDALNAIENYQNKNGNNKYKIPKGETIESEITQTLDFGGKFILANEPNFPQSLGAITPPPPLISIIGDENLLQKPMIAMVGARNASMVGIKMAREIAHSLGQSGYIIVSGLARGIDGAAHFASMKSGTIAVLAGGIDHIYPPEHKDLYESIKNTGLIISENPFSAKVHARDFPRRNRIISGLSLGVIVVEAEEKSGSLITARYANEQGREIMAIPGSPLDPRAKGPNGLIKQGAALITNANDIIDIIKSQTKLCEPDYNIEFNFENSVSIDNSTTLMVQELLSPTPISLDDIVLHTNLPWRTIAAIVVELEMEGKATLRNGNMASSV